MSRHFKENLFWIPSKYTNWGASALPLESEPALATDISIHGQLASLIMNNFLLFCQEQRQRRDSGALKVNYRLCLNLPSWAELSAAAASPGKDESSQSKPTEVPAQPTRGTLPPLRAQPRELRPLQR